MGILFKFLVLCSVLGLSSLTTDANRTTSPYVPSSTSVPRAVSDTTSIALAATVTNTTTTSPSTSSTFSPLTQTTSRLSSSASIVHPPNSSISPSPHSRPTTLSAVASASSELQSVTQSIVVINPSSSSRSTQPSLASNVSSSANDSGGDSGGDTAASVGSSVGTQAPVSAVTVVMTSGPNESAVSPTSTSVTPESSSTISVGTSSQTQATAPLSTATVPSQRNVTSVTPSVTPSTSFAVMSSPTPPPQVKYVPMKATFALVFKPEYSNKQSPEYKELEKNLTTVLTVALKDVNGFKGIQILGVSEGSVVCDFIVILRESSTAGAVSLKVFLKEASDAGKLGTFKVTKVEVTETGTEKPKEVLPVWALVTMIALGAVAFIFLVTIIALAVCYRHNTAQAPMFNTVDDEWGRNYETLAMGDYKLRASDFQSSHSGHIRKQHGENGAGANLANQPQSHVNLTYEVPVTAVE